MSGRKERHEKRRKRRESTSSETSSSSDSSSSEVQVTRYTADLEAFLHSVGMTGTSNDLSLDPNPKKEKKEKPKKDKKPKEDKEHKVRTPIPQTSKSGIPLPMSNVHLQSGGKGMLESPDPPSIVK